jgi:peptidoglycan/xylan/chitin deacetylase (PgdA/CDA1 family)
VGKLQQLKHRGKGLAREVYARALFHSGLHRLLNRAMPARLTILAGHCVSGRSNAALPKDMKIRAEDLERILSFLQRHFELVTVGAGVRSLDLGPRRSMVALSMDDGYKDNHTLLLPLLKRVGCSATVYLESAPLDERSLNWTHKFFHALKELGPERFVQRYCALSRDRAANAKLAEHQGGSARAAYHLKRILKYEVEPQERTRVVDELFHACGGVERELCDALYMNWEDARALDAAGIELGAHTVHHEILSRLDAAGCEREIAGSKAALERGLGHPLESFAYPFGRRWDYHAQAQASAAAAGFASATNTHAGVNLPATGRMELRRIMIDEDARLHLIVAEACGGFELLRRAGIDLSE